MQNSYIYGYSEVMSLGTIALYGYGECIIRDNVIDKSVSSFFVISVLLNDDDCGRNVNNSFIFENNIVGTAYLPDGQLEATYTFYIALSVTFTTILNNVVRVSISGNTFYNFPV
jgi:hypothetical protein